MGCFACMLYSNTLNDKDSNLLWLIISYCEKDENTCQHIFFASAIQIKVMKKSVISEPSNSKSLFSNAVESH